MAKSFVYGLRYSDGPIVYVGSTIFDPQKRLADHIKKADSLCGFRNSRDFRPVLAWILACPDRSLISVEMLAEIESSTATARYACEKALIQQVAMQTLVSHKIVTCNLDHNPYRLHYRVRNSEIDFVSVWQVFSDDVPDVMTAEEAVAIPAASEAVQ